MANEVVFLRHRRTTCNLASGFQDQIDVSLDIVGQRQVDIMRQCPSVSPLWDKDTAFALGDLGPVRVPSCQRAARCRRRT